MSLRGTREEGAAEGSHLDNRKIVNIIYQKLADHVILRSSLPDVFCEKGVLRNFVKFTGKHLCQILFFNRVAGFKDLNLQKQSPGDAL